jgi:hypothetical protein
MQELAHRLECGTADQPYMLVLLFPFVSPEKSSSRLDICIETKLCLGGKTPAISSHLKY